MKLSHVDASGRPRMVDVGPKAETARRAVAEGRIRMSSEAFEVVVRNINPKGDVLTTAELAGTMGAKRTADLIPLCHPLLISSVTVEFTSHKQTGRIDIEARVKVSGKTGVEMEALTAVSVAALTIYDMCKAVEKDMTISAISLQHKSGGKSGTYSRTP